MSGGEIFGGLSGMEIIATLCAIAAPISVAFIAIIGRLNGRDDDDPDAILPPVEEPLGDMVDVRRIIHRYSED